MLSNPGQQLDVAASNPEVIANLETDSDNWLQGVHPLPPIDPVILIPSQKSLKNRSVALPAHEAMLTSPGGRGIRYAGPQLLDHRLVRHRSNDQLDGRRGGSTAVESDATLFVQTTGRRLSIQDCVWKLDKRIRCG
jgi:hypothetical protein